MQDTSSVFKGGRTIKLIELFSIVKMLALEKSLFSLKNNNKVFFNPLSGIIVMPFVCQSVISIHNVLVFTPFLR